MPSTAVIVREYILFYIKENKSGYNAVKILLRTIVFYQQKFIFWHLPLFPCQSLTSFKIKIYFLFKHIRVNEDTNKNP